MHTGIMSHDRCLQLEVLCSQLEYTRCGFTWFSKLLSVRLAPRGQGLLWQPHVGQGSARLFIASGKGMYGDVQLCMQGVGIFNTLGEVAWRRDLDLSGEENMARCWPVLLTRGWKSTKALKHGPCILARSFNENMCNDAQTSHSIPTHTSGYVTVRAARLS